MEPADDTQPHLIDADLMEALLRVEVELARRESRPLRLLGLIGVDPKGHADLAAARAAAFGAAAARLAVRPPIRVRSGDWIRINDHRFRVGAVDLERGTAETEWLAQDGTVASVVRVDAAWLEPERKGAGPWPGAPLPPTDLRDALQRCKAARRAHERAVGPLLRE